MSWSLAFSRLTELTVTYAAVAISDSPSSLGTADSALAFAPAAASTFAAGCETSCDPLSCAPAEAAESLESVSPAGFSSSVATESAPVVSEEVPSSVGSASCEATAWAMPSAPSAHSCAGVVPKTISMVINATRTRAEAILMFLIVRAIRLRAPSLDKAAGCRSPPCGCCPITSDLLSPEPCAAWGDT